MSNDWQQLAYFNFIRMLLLILSALGPDSHLSYISKVRPLLCIPPGATRGSLCAVSLWIIFLISLTAESICPSLEGS